MDLNNLNDLTLIRQMKLKLKEALVAVFLVESTTALVLMSSSLNLP